MGKGLKEEGLTFLEVMISVTIFGLLIAPLYSLLAGGMALYQISDAQLEQLQNMRVAMESLGRDIREANSITFDKKTNRLTIVFSDGNSKQYGLDSESIYSPSGLKGKKLWKGAVWNPLASYLSGFEVTSIGKLVTVKLTATSPKGRILTLENKFVLRN